MHDIPNLVTILAKRTEGTPLAAFLITWENMIFSLIIIAGISIVALILSRKNSAIPDRLQSAGELLVGGFDDFVCGIIGPSGRKYTPFIGTLFIYILIMNLSGLVPFMKSPTTSWSITLALALCVFAYVLYASIKELGILGFIDHMMDRPRGIIAFTVFMPMMMLFLNIISLFVRPISLSLRLRSNVWGDDLLLSFIAGFGIKGLPLMIFNSALIIVASIVQAAIFCLLTTIYFAFAVAHEER